MQHDRRSDPEFPVDAGPDRRRHRFVDVQQVIDAISVKADGFRSTDDQIEIRWPALFFGFRRCVYVTWTPSGVECRDDSGPSCTDFIG